MPKSGKPPRLRVVGREEMKPSEFGTADALYFRELHRLVDQVFTEADQRCGWNWSQLAESAGLAYATVANLGDRRTKWPQFRTVWRLCKAVGWDLIVKSKPKSKRTTLKLAKSA